MNLVPDPPGLPRSSSSVGLLVVGHARPLLFILFYFLLAAQLFALPVGRDVVVGSGVLTTVVACSDARSIGCPSAAVVGIGLTLA
ncbi:hypothetical protein R1flu_023641 [Riccia fluitans]|uniref:Uncharacterized protein n=1 Tax=Riccia fluitans TaxID=41844 RepID=A0ABD1XSN6_9MARC